MACWNFKDVHISPTLIQTSGMQIDRTIHPVLKE